MPQPLMLADLEIRELIGLAVVVITFLSWLVKQLKGVDAAGRPAAPPPRPADKPLRSEIEVFLKELAKSQPEAVRNPPAQQRKPSPPKPRPEKPRKVRQPESPPPAQRPKPVAQLETQHLPSSELGQGLRAHVSTFMAPDRVTSEAQQFVGDRVDDAVRKDLGTTSTARPAAPSSHPLLAMLAQPAGVRQAFVLNEVLQKPKALRK